MQHTLRFVLLGSLALAGAACSPTPQADVTPPAATPAAQDAPMDAADATAMQPPAMEPDEMPADALLARARIPRADATRTALAQVPNGTIQAAELEDEHQKLVWSFDIAQPDSRDITEIQVDAVTGDIASTQVETPTDQAQEAAADKAGR